MKRYIGIKEVLAKPMTLAEYNVYRGWVAPGNENTNADGYLIEYADSDNANHAAHKGYISWSPKDVFDRAYFTMENGLESVLRVDNFEPHQKRVLTEWSELSEKVSKLEVFVLDGYKRVPISEQELSLLKLNC